MKGKKGINRLFYSKGINRLSYSPRFNNIFSAVAPEDIFFFI